MNRTARLTAPGRRTLIVALLALLALPAALRAQHPARDAAAPRVAIVLGNAPRGVDEPTAAQTARCLKGFALYQGGTVNKLLVTGGFTLGHVSEARMMKIALVTWGVPPDDVIEDELAATTRENASFSARIFDQRGWPKKAVIVSQKFHLPRAATAFKENGFEVEEAAAADAVTGPEAFALVPDLKPGDKAVEALKVEPTDLIVVHEPYASLDPVEWPTPQLAHRLRTAAALYHRKAAPRIVLSNDPYTRGPIALTEMMKIALVSLGVPSASIESVARGEYRGLSALARASGDKSATVLTSSTAKISIPPDLASKWKVVVVE